MHAQNAIIASVYCIHDFTHHRGTNGRYQMRPLPTYQSTLQKYQHRPTRLPIQLTQVHQNRGKVNNLFFLFYQQKTEH